MKSGDYAWLSIFGYEVAAAVRKWELLSTAMDRYRKARPVLVFAGCTYLYLHLLRVIPPRYDLLTRLTSLGGR